ncbi:MULTISPECIES: 2,3-bisphosphoglycerate-dependent phosphoglycerate mutase [unclassified Streptomyces]|uniref:2,3-bisphosphoglycerate-dependent phosphoglycerate mutase n=1 Tax=unclassified Streptomyces TaxID=2593676 RepID=UPI002E788ECA|nr:2,3-bisphosphoglycerate-dependent phosphoglycerate mutase [Streptomyces sp. JV184]MEE1748405.1 2,3-bisphosphoglycerate-dependent phosphoglycerate mutase [Streptomyces sp. JV184]MEE1748472.1 2,3-bisphosphoglycerate-dependent phosphoglycerate mutase [Streptomyces sp. JV184]
MILLRHGQSTTNAEGRFTGWADAPLTPHGEQQAVRAAGLPARDGPVPGLVLTSVLRRSIRTADILLSHLDRAWVPVHRTWRLNERQYGPLTGPVEREVRREAGLARYRAWRRSLTGAPAPLAEDELARLREVENLNIPTGAPLLHPFDAALRPTVCGGRYAEPDAARTAAEAVAVEGHD